MATVFISSFNHASLAGVAEIVELIAEEFKRAGFNAKSCEVLPIEAGSGDMVVLVDEFSEPAVLEGLRRYKKVNQGVKLICVLTEFFSPGNMVRPPSLNSFKEPLCSLLFDNLLYVFTFLTGKHKLFSSLALSRPNPMNYLFGSIALCWLALLKLWKFRTPLKKLPSFHDRGYLWFRTLGLLSVSGVFDHYFVLHPGICSDELASALGTKISRLGFLIIPPPEIEKSSLVNPTLKFGVDFSGSLSTYRWWQLRKFRKLIARISPGERFARYTMRGFDDSKLEHYLSFNPPQSSTWHYSSPMRIIGALKRGQIPIVPKKFGDHPAEDLTLTPPETGHDVLAFVSSLVFFEHFYLDSAWEKLENYRQIAAKHNGNELSRLLDAKAVSVRNMM